jgi:hypothetical protein
MVGNFNDNGLNVNNLHPDNANNNVWAVPLVVIRMLCLWLFLYLFCGSYPAAEHFAYFLKHLLKDKIPTTRDGLCVFGKS